MKLPKLVKTSRQLRNLMRHSSTEILASWTDMGPCPEFICAPAVEFFCKGESYIVFMTAEKLVAFHTDLKKKDAENTGA